MVHDAEQRPVQRHLPGSSGVLRHPVPGVTTPTHGARLPAVQLIRPGQQCRMTDGDSTAGTDATRPTQGGRGADAPGPRRG